MLSHLVFSVTLWNNSLSLCVKKFLRNRKVKLSAQSHTICMWEDQDLNSVCKAYAPKYCTSPISFLPGGFHNLQLHISLCEYLSIMSIFSLDNKFHEYKIVIFCLLLHSLGESLGYSGKAINKYLLEDEWVISYRHSVV